MSYAFLAAVSCAFLAAVSFAFLCAGCAATNYLDAAGPVYRGRFAAAAARPAAAPSPKAPLRVVSFNIAFAIEIDSALAVLRHEPDLQRPDILALQEMDAPSVERIARALQLDYVYFPSGFHPKYDRDFGCAVLSPWPLIEARKIVMPHRSRITGLQRVVTVVTLQRGAGRWRVYSVHLPSPVGISGESRREEIDLLVKDASSSPDPVIIAGDFNSEDAGEAFVRAGFVWPTREIPATVRALGVGFRYDHVLARGLRPAPAPAAGVVLDNRQASDHCPIWAVLVPE
ncbi:MAG TPA: endonuclease/exonuclease/phosphatase family protein [Candidatus Krumholzibacteria bacterium]|nr:endonuclease/exonuclease/phosphatase family protein [Candidatus Krumholzibacteria bacterium]